MPSKSLPKTKQIIDAFPEITFKTGVKASWNPRSRIVTYSDDDIFGLIHEVAHAELNHNNFSHDIELIKMERDAWDLARRLAKDKFGLRIPDDYAEDCLDSYRDWLYRRAKCPRCHLVGIQVDKHAYACVHCHIDWGVSSSRLCAVKRKILA